MEVVASTRLFLIRHGEVENAHEKRYNGHRDVPLNETGIEQMKAVAERLAKEKLAAVYSSTLMRTVRGAEYVAKRHDIMPVACDPLRELNFGDWEGLNFEEIEKRYPGALNEWGNSTMGYRIPGGESVEALKDRVIPCIHRIIEEHSGESVAVVAHGGVNRVILSDALGLRLERFYSIAQDYGCLNIIEYYGGLPVVRRMNCAVCKDF